MGPAPPTPLWLALLLLGCTAPGSTAPDRPTATGSGTPVGSPSTDSGTPPPPPSVELGNGEHSHEPLAANDPITLVLGGQGGWHIDVSGQVQGLGEIVSIESSLFDPAGAELGHSEGAVGRWLREWNPQTRTGWFAGERAFLPDGALASICPLDGTAVELCAEVVDLLEPERRAAACVEGIATLRPEDRALCGS